MTKYLLLGCVLASAGCLKLTKKTDDTTATKAKEEPKEHEAKAPAEVEFPEGDKALMKAAPKWAKDFAEPPPTVKRAFLVDETWGMNRADNNVIVGRFAKAVVFYKGGESGHCFQALCNLKEEEQNGSWGKPYLQCINEYTTRVVCDSIESLRGQQP